jgi:hypothetical protein
MELGHGWQCRILHDTIAATNDIGAILHIRFRIVHFQIASPFRILARWRRSLLISFVDRYVLIEYIEGLFYSRELDRENASAVIYWFRSSLAWAELAKATHLSPLAPAIETHHTSRPSHSPHDPCSAMNHCNNTRSGNCHLPCCSSSCENYTDTHRPAESNQHMSLQSHVASSFSPLDPVSGPTPLGCSCWPSVPAS